MKSQAQPIGKYATDDVRRYVDKHLVAGLLILIGGAAAQFDLYLIAAGLILVGITSWVVLHYYARQHLALVRATGEPPPAPPPPRLTIDGGIRDAPNHIAWSEHQLTANADTWQQVAVYLAGHPAHMLTRRQLAVSGEEYQLFLNDVETLFGDRKPDEDAADWIVSTILNTQRDHFPSSTSPRENSGRAGLRPTTTDDRAIMAHRAGAGEMWLTELPAATIDPLQIGIMTLIFAAALFGWWQIWAFLLG